MPHHCILYRLKWVDIIKLSFAVSNKSKFNSEWVFLISNEFKKAGPMIEKLGGGGFLPITDPLRGDQKFTCPLFIVLAAWHISLQEDTCSLLVSKGDSISLRASFVPHLILPWSVFWGKQTEG